MRDASGKEGTGGTRHPGQGGRHAGQGARHAGQGDRQGREVCRAGRQSRIIPEDIEATGSGRQKKLWLTTV